MVNHIHDFKFDAEISNCHTHSVAGYTDCMLGVNALHFHYFSGISTYKNHTHHFSGYTGPPIKTENGHVHKISGYLESRSFHSHKFNNYTYEEVSYNSPRLHQRVMI
ncbi:MAG TPA: hypothetical protein GXX49_07975 [Clostridiaceae bacterium]|nr:hypothetical protein [Clostridiaceae bacterium]